MSEYIRKIKIDTNKNKYLLGKYQTLFFLWASPICHLQLIKSVPLDSKLQSRCLPGPDISLLILISGSKQAILPCPTWPGQSFRELKSEIEIWDLQYIAICINTDAAFVSGKGKPRQRWEFCSKMLPNHLILKLSQKFVINFPLWWKLNPER